MGGMVSQNVLNLVDTAMVGTLGDDALAAVGMGGFICFMAQSFVMGLGSGVQAMVARREGEGRSDQTGIALNGGLVFGLLFGIPIAVVLVWFSPTFFPWLHDDPAVLLLGVPYIQARLCAIPGVGTNFAFRGFWNGVNRSGLYLRTLLVMHVTNMVLNYALIFGELGAPEMGAPGAGIGTAIATYVGSIYYLYLGRTRAPDSGFLKGMPSREILGRVLRLSLPTGFQTLFFATGMTVLFGIIARVGTRELAAANVLINITLVAILPAIGLGLASGSLVGQALGRGDPDDAYRWAWDVVKVALVVLGLLAIPMLTIPDLLLGGFIHDMETLELARLPLQLVGGYIIVDAVALVLLNSLIGAGATLSAASWSVGLQWGIFLPAAWIVGPVMGYGLLGIWLAQMGFRLLQALAFVILWQRRGWVTARA